MHRKFTDDELSDSQSVARIFQGKSPANSHLSARYLSVSDQHKSQRDDYVRTAFGAVAQRRFADDETFVLSRAGADYDVLLIGGGNPARMGRFVRANRSLLNGIARIAVVSGSTPARRARLLSAGFDDVFDIARTPAEEARARIGAIVRSHALARQAVPSAGQLALAVKPICKPVSLTEREVALLGIMAANPGRAVAVAQLARQFDHQDPARLRRSIQVTMSNLRRKLLPLWCIRADLHGGYGLYRSNPDT